VGKDFGIFFIVEATPFLRDFAEQGRNFVQTFWKQKGFCSNILDSTQDFFQTLKTFTQNFAFEARLFVVPV
jgi:hypothetical protein